MATIVLLVRVFVPRFLPLLLFPVLFLCGFTSLGHCLAASDSGRWTPPNPLPGTAVHMALIRGHDTFHSTVMWWYGKGEHAEFYGGLLGWKPGEYNCGSYPDTSLLKPIALPLPDSAGVFCSSNSSLANGDLFLAGGTQPFTEFGTRHAYTFNPTTVTWTKTDSMSEFRFYPTSTALPDGRQIVLSGSQDHFLSFFGGLTYGGTTPVDSAVFRYGDGANGRALSAVRASTSPVWPSPREGHTATGRDGATTHLFGGKDRVGRFKNDYWQLNRGDNTFYLDFDYQWKQTIVPNPPAARWDHTTVDVPGNSRAWMIVFGGIAKSPEDTTLDVVMNDVWRLWYDPQGGGLKWTRVTILPSTYSPGPLCGHVSLWRAADSSMVVFGGRDSPSASPSDSSLWSLNFTSSTLDSAAWEKLSAVGPGPRFHHALGYDAIGLADTAFVFGGEAPGGANLNDLWRLNVNSLTWDKITYLGGSPPSVRSRHSATLQGGSRQLFVFGGRSDDSTVYVAHLGVTQPGELRMWVPYRTHSPAIRGHTAFFGGVGWARTPEIYDPAAAVGSRWSQLPNAAHLQNYYPQTFVWKPDTVFVAGPDSFSYKLPLNNSTWVQYPQGNSGLRGGDAVIYRPGKVMKCGSRDFEAQYATPAVGETRRVDLNAGASAQWASSANDMLPRVNHNLVLLPNGKVLVVGGTAAGDTTTPQKRPEIWDPDNSGGIGGWFGRDTLASQLRLRDYHSTAMLLPDGRVISGGGNGNKETQKDVEIFCPPYLFKSDGSLAARPPLSESPQRVRYGAQFSACLSSSDSISSACLIRPAAVTHGFNENQRYVPLTITPVNIPTTRVTVTAPPDSFQAPPGDYLLFLLNKKGVPSVARWVRMGYSWSEGDNTRPARITDLTRDMETNSAISLYWTAVGDDGTSGTASYADLRRSTSPIDSLNFGSATAVNPQPVPVCTGTTQIQVVTGLSPNTTYYFAVKFSDESGNVSLISNVVSGTTLGQCCEGERAKIAREGGTSARRTGGAKGAGEAFASAGASSSSATASGATPLVIEAAPQTGGLDLRLFAIGGENFEGHTFSDGGGALLQKSDGGGGWSTLAQYDLPPGDRIALPAPDQATRWVLLEPLALEKVLPEVAGSAAGWILDQARHSREGDVEGALSAFGAAPSMNAGDTLTVHYAAATESARGAPDWLLVVDRPASGAGSTRAGGRRPDPNTALPKVFALSQNLPNPFAATTTIRFALPVASRVRLEVFDLVGRRVRTLASALYPPGEHEVEWNRRTTNGALASPGLYFYRMNAGQYQEKRRMVILP
jgi:hypothetical protein